jgi:hypothetical protein
MLCSQDEPPTKGGNVKVKLSQIIDAMPAVSKLAQKEMPAKAAYRISKIVRKMVSEMKAFNEARDKAIKKHGEQDTVQVKGEDRRVWKVKPENADAFNAEIEALMGSEVELTGVAKIAFSDLDGLQIAPGILTDLDFVIDEGA